MTYEDILFLTVFFLVIFFFAGSKYKPGSLFGWIHQSVQMNMYFCRCLLNTDYGKVAEYF